MRLHFTSLEKSIQGRSAAIGALVLSACCPTTAGPTGPAAAFTVTLEPGQFHYFDADTPSSTTQINLTFRIEATDVPVQIQQIDPACPPADRDTCQPFYDATLPPRSPGVVQFGNSLQPRGASTRIVLRNPTENRTITLSVTIVPYRAGCT